MLRRRDQKLAVSEKRAEAANIRLVSIGKYIEQKLFEAKGGEGADFGARKGPGHLALGLRRFTAARNDQQLTARAKKGGNVFDGLWAQRGRKDLDGVGFENEIEIASPMRRRIEKIGRLIVDGGMRKAFSGRANGGFRNIERGGAKTPGGKLLGVITEATAGNQCGFPGSLLRMGYPETDEWRSGMVIDPGHNTLPCFPFAVQNFEPARRVAFAVKLRGEFARSSTVLHAKGFYLAPRPARHSNRGSGAETE